jgi:hypothetical protein
MKVDNDDDDDDNDGGGGKKGATVQGKIWRRQKKVVDVLMS